MTFDGVFGVSPEDRGLLRRMIVVSLLLHVFALSLSSLFSTVSSPKDPMSLNYTVDLVGPAEIAMKGESRKGSAGGPAKKHEKLPTATTKVGISKADLPSPRPVNKSEGSKRPDKSTEKVVEKSAKREHSAPTVPSKPLSKSEKIKGSETAKGDAIERILRRADSPQKASKPVSKTEKIKGSETARGDAIADILKRANSSPQVSSKPALKGDSAKGSEASLGTAMDEIRKRVDYAEQKQRAATASAGTGNRSGIVAGSGASGITAGSGLPGPGSNAELNARMYAYYRVIWARIKKHWTMSPGLLPRENIGAIIHVRVLRNGTVEGVSFEKRSGNNYFDESALRAVRKASPFPPLPEGMGENDIEMGIRFHSAELR